MAGTVPVTFVPAGKTVWVSPGTTVLQAAQSAGIVIPAPCGGAGRCGKCAVRVIEGTPPEPGVVEVRGLKLAPRGMRLACLLKVESPLTVRPVIAQPTRSLGATEVREPGRELLAAVDLGTTSVQAVVVDAESGLELGRSSVPNAQQSWGSDVMARVGAALEGHGPALQKAAEDSILQALQNACGHAGGCLRNVTRLVIAGNTVMVALLFSDDVSTLAEAPYEAATTRTRSLSGDARVTQELGSSAEITVLPGVGGFVGGDLAAGLAVSGLQDYDDPGMFIDLGTNAEIAVFTKGSVSVSSAAAGPAFEGYGIANGGPALDGAVERVRFTDGRLALKVIGGGEPHWLCGSGLVSAIRALRDAGHIGSDGRMTPDGPLSSDFTEIDGIVAVTLSGSQGAGVVLTQKDIRSFQLAKGAVAAGLALVAQEAGIKPRKRMRFIVAGAFGSALDPDDLVELGVLPQEAGDGVHLAGNTSLLGAAMVAVRPDVVERIEDMVSRAMHVELAMDDRFNEVFLASMSLEPYSLKKRMRMSS